MLVNFWVFENFSQWLRKRQGSHVQPQEDWAWPQGKELWFCAAFPCGFNYGIIFRVVVILKQISCGY